MRSVLGKAVRKRFAERVRERLSQFREIKTKGIPSLCRLYEWRTDPGLTFYLMLQLHRNRDWFTIELGWSRSGQFPSLTRLPESPHQETAAVEMCFRLGKLWESQKDVWWEFVPRLSPLEATFDDFMNEPPVEDLLPKVDPLVEDAIQHILADAIPYFRKVAAAHGFQIEEHQQEENL